MEYEEIKLLKQSEKSTVHLVRNKGEGKVFVRKVLKGQRTIYAALKNCPHPYLPKLYEVIFSDSSTTVIEEYIEGDLINSGKLSEKQFKNCVRELCSVLEFLHGKGIIHRDIKPSNIILAKDGHIRLIDFDAARMPKEDQEQDTMLLGTRGYAPPEQYGFAQTDERTDIYSLGVVLKQFLGEKGQKPHYQRVIRKCTNLDPDKRYQSVRQVRWAFSYMGRNALCGCLVLLLLVFLWGVANVAGRNPVQGEGTSAASGQGSGSNVAEQPVQKETGQEGTGQEEAEQPGGPVLAVLEAPAEPHWNGDTGIAVWGNVFESGQEGEVRYHWRMYRMDTPTPPEPDDSGWMNEGDMGGNDQIGALDYTMNLSYALGKNGFYYFTVAAKGDGVNYTDSPYAVSDAFEYTGEAAPALPVPTGLEWVVIENENGPQHYATWDNLEDYEDTDSFEVWIYDQSGQKVRNNKMPKERIMTFMVKGIWFNQDIFTEDGGAYRFTVQALTSRPNEYSSSPMPNPVPEEYYSPWYYPGKE